MLGIRWYSNIGFCLKCGYKIKLWIALQRRDGQVHFALAELNGE